MSHTYKDRKVAHVQGLRRSGASGFHNKRGYDRKQENKELQKYKNNVRIKIDE
jgi:hypothetical protein